MSKLKGPGNGIFIKDFITSHLPPMTWNIIAVKVMKLFVKHKLKVTTIAPTDELPDEIVEAINQILNEQYSTQLPNA